MNNTDISCLIIGLLGFLIIFANIITRRHKKYLPTVLGSTVPLKPHAIDFSRRYNICTSGSRWDGGGVSRDYKSVRIIGYVDNQQDGGGKFGQDWIVLELSDSRKLYLTPQSIQVMEEVSDENRNA